LKRILLDIVAISGNISADLVLIHSGMFVQLKFENMGIFLLHIKQQRVGSYHEIYSF